jgi:ribonuclease R
MADDYYRFREQSHALFGENTRKTYRLGDRVKVQIIKVDMERRQIDLGLADVLDKVRRDERSRGPARSSARPKKESAFAKATARQADKGKFERRRQKKQRPGKNERKRRT